MRVAMLGPLEVRDADGRPLEVTGGRLRALLILLALRPGQVVPARTLIDALWDGDAPTGAPNALQALVSRLRRAVPEGAIESGPTGYRLVAVPSDVDCERFEALVSAGRAAARGRDPARAEALLGEALSLWRGPALVDAGGAAFAQGPAARLTELRLAAAEERAEAALAVGRDPVGLVPELDALAIEFPLREGLAAQLMRALRAAGRPAEALAAYERTRTALADQLGTDPSPALAALHLAVLRAEPPPSTVDSNLRAALTSFVGRDEDVAAIGKLLTEARLTTLTGPGGAGKTRLAIEAARGAAGQLADAVWLVELAPVTDPDEVPSAALAALGLRERALFGRRQPGEPDPDALDRLAAGLSGRRSLLVLDNCEHLIGAAAALADRLLGDCPQLRILATSREPLAITGEALWPVEPLALPPLDVEPRAALEYAAVRMFADRAAAVRPGFAVGPDNANAVARICRALDGMPLAIELAAARLRSLTPEQVADRLGNLYVERSPLGRGAAGATETGPDADGSHATVDRGPLGRRAASATETGPDADGSHATVDRGPLGRRAASAAETGPVADGRFRLLTGGSRTALARHQTLRAVVDWSWDLLDDAERALWRRLAVFSGGATLTAVERVCAGDAEQIDDVVDLLGALVDKSLVVFANDRYTMLETIKAYGLERLAEAGEAGVYCGRHVAYFVELAETAEPHLRAEDQLSWLRWLAADHENLHLAVRRAVDAGDAERALRLVAALGWYWWLCGYRREGADLTADALALPGDAPDDVRALAYTYGALNGISGHGNFERSREWLLAAVGLAGGTGATHPVLRLVDAFTAAFGNPDHATITFALNAFAVRYDDPDPWVRAAARSFHAYGDFNEGRDAAAERDLREALAGFRSLGERWGVSFTLGALAELATLRGDHRAAADCLAESVAHVSSLGTNEDLTQAQTWYARQLWLIGERAEAERLLVEAERTAAAVGLPELTASIEYERAEIARWLGDLASAATRLAKAEALMSSWPGPPHLIAMIRGSLGWTALEAGDLDTARFRFGQALPSAVAAHDQPVLRRILVGLSGYALAAGDPATAAALFGAAANAEGEPFRAQPEAPRVEAALREALGDGAFRTAYARGRQMSYVDLAVAAGLPAPD